MEDGLAGARADIEDGPVTVFDGTLAGDVRGGEMAAADEFGVLGLCILETGKMFLGDYEDVGRTLRVEIFEGEGVGVFVNFFRGHFAADNAAEKAIRHIFGLAVGEASDD